MSANVKIFNDQYSRQPTFRKFPELFSRTTSNERKASASNFHKREDFSKLKCENNSEKLASARAYRLKCSGKSFPSRRMFSTLSHTQSSCVIQLPFRLFLIRDVQGEKLRQQTVGVFRLTDSVVEGT